MLYNPTLSITSCILWMNSLRFVVNPLDIQILELLTIYDLTIITY